MTVTLPPHLAELLREAGGHWPEADEDQLAAMADKWKNISKTLDTMRTDGNRVASAVTAENRGASIEAFSSYWSANLDRHLASASTGAEQAAVAVTGMTKTTIAAKTAIVDTLGSAQQAIINSPAKQMIGPLIGGLLRTLLRPLLRALAEVLSKIIKWLVQKIVELVKLIIQGVIWLFKKIGELVKRLFGGGKSGKPKPGKGVKEVMKKDLKTSRGQIEKKYNRHARDFGVNEPRGRDGFDKFDQAVKKHVDDSETMHIDGIYNRGAGKQQATLNYNPKSGLCVVQKPTGEFITGWKLSPAQPENVAERGTLDGG